MKFTLSWLSNFVSLEGLDASLLSDKLTMLGLEVEAVEELFAELDIFVTCRVEKVEKHPDADKLTVCSVTVGKGEPLSVVCGAPNVQEGMVSALALPGTKLPDGTKIKKAKVRGVASNGMLCSARELGLSEDHTGIMELDRSLPSGAPLATALGLRDTVIEVDLTPNRPDCASVMGIAREVASIQGLRMNTPVSDYTPLTGKGLDYRVTIEEPELCPRYAARKVCNVTIKPSPLWMQQRLLAVGMRPINNIVDITNYVMLEMGQPLHAFDFDTLKGKAIVVRKPKKDELEFVTLDNSTRTLDSDMLMICDAEEPIAVAGIMGGLNTEVTEETVDILLESACFNAVSVRKSCRRLNIPSEASYRFERGVDPELAPRALERAVALIEKYGDAQAEHTGIDAYPGARKPLELTLRTDRVCKLLGIQLRQDTIAEYLRSIEFEVVHNTPDDLGVTVPTFRVDIEREIDLIEEVARLVGYNEIPTASPRIAMQHPKPDSMREMKTKIAHILTAQGVYEAINYSFVTEKHLDYCLLGKDDQRRKVTRLLNPLSEDQGIMRSMILPGLLENVRRNCNYQQQDVRLFEAGKVFEECGEGLPVEYQQLCAVISGNRYPEGQPLYFSGNNADFYDIKGLVVSIIQTLRLTDVVLQPLVAETENTVAPYCQPGCAEELRYGGERIGLYGMVHEQTIRNFDIKQNVFFLEIDLDRLGTLSAKQKQFVPLPKFPSVRRDIALLVPSSVQAGKILETIKRQKQKLVESIDIFDVYQGETIEKGMKSVALSVMYRSSKKTLDDKTVDHVHDSIVQLLMNQFKARYREGT
ncbi:MAG: phenylalanine--tRNA ligase subunit beta [Desulfobulbus propionicus]|nr:MAG: phenylalanine--tRNA ligase subunit beta [Desulfobulbus propionicus]